MEFLTRFLSQILRPILAPMSRWLTHRRRPTWQYEALITALVLFGVATLTTDWNHLALRPFLINWIAAAAVLGSFLQAQVGFRMAEAQANEEKPSVLCHAWSGQYWLAKEILWFLVFFLSGAYAAIAGNVVFILYPAWRSIHVRERKLARS